MINDGTILAPSSPWTPFVVVGEPGAHSVVANLPSVFGLKVWLHGRFWHRAAIFGTAAKMSVVGGITDPFSPAVSLLLLTHFRHRYCDAEIARGRWADHL